MTPMLDPTPVLYSNVPSVIPSTPTKIHKVVRETFLVYSSLI